MIEKLSIFHENPLPAGVVGVWSRVDDFAPHRARCARDGSGVGVYIINTDGCIVDVKVVEATNPEFGAALAAAAEAFTYVPAMRDGKPTQTLLRMDQTFTGSRFSSVV